MKRLRYLLVGLVLAATLLGACAPATPAVVEKEVIRTVVVEKEVAVEKKVVETVIVEKVATPTPSAPQIMRFGVDSEPTHLDWDFLGEGVARVVTYNVYEPLLEYSYDDELNIVGCLAEEFGWTDNVTWWFKLHEGVKFHNGRELVAEDVKNSIDRVLDPAAGSPRLTTIDAIDNIEVTGKYTGVIHLKTPYVGLQAYALQNIPIIPKEAWGDLKTHPVGTGPFVFKEWIQGQKVILVKNQEYWREGLPRLDQLEIQFFSQYQTLLQSLRAGNTDVISWLGNADVEPLKREGKLDVWGMPYPGFFYLSFNVKIPPFDNKLVRQAAMYAVDKDAVLEIAQAGYGDTGSINIPKGHALYLEGFDYERDVEKAKQLLAEAGYPNGIEGELIAPDTPTERPIAESVAFSLSEAGINLTPNIMQVAEFINRFVTTRDAGAHICGYNSAGDPDFFDWRFRCEATNNLYNYCNPEADKYLTIGHTEPDLETRRAAYQGFYEILLDEVPIIFLIQEYRFQAKHPYVKEYKSNAAQWHNFAEAYISK